MPPSAKDWFRVFLWGGEILRINRAAAKVAPLRIRAFSSSDLEACLAIYRIHEAIRFPPGYYEVYKDYLSGGGSLVLVAEKDSRVVATGGIAIQRTHGVEVSMLSFGMVLPDYQRQGVGTTLLLARLSRLPQTQKKWIVCMTSVGGSNSFYGRYGFRFVANVDGMRSDHLPLYRMTLLRKDIDKIKTMLAGQKVTVEDSGRQVPVVEVAENAKA
jgi:ribosomal protein S18 acetylase RimI-like enzyme